MLEKVVLNSFLIALIFIVSLPAQAVLTSDGAGRTSISNGTQASQYQTVGEDWLRMSPDDKTLYLFTTREVFSHWGVRLSIPLGDYINLLDAYITKNPSIHNQDLAFILLSLAYELDPATKEGIHNLKKPIPFVSN